MEAVLNGCLYMYCFEMMRICEYVFFNVCSYLYCRGPSNCYRGDYTVLLNSFMSAPNQDLVIQSHMSCLLSSMVYCERWLLALMIFVE